MRSARLEELHNDSSLPELQLAQRRVALCITGGARGFPLESMGLYQSIRTNVVDALNANVTDIYYLLELNDWSDRLAKGGTFNYSMADLMPAFALLPPKVAVLTTARPRARCTDGCYNQVGVCGCVLG
jgi:hypothetical protein